MPKDTVVLIRYANAVQAETLRGRLAVAGIEARVFGTDSAIALNMGGASTISGVRVEVFHADYDRAKAILEEDERIRREAGDWTCGRCDQENDAAFERCWNCQKDRGKDDLAPKPAAQQDQAIASGLTDPETDSGHGVPVAVAKNSLNPYQPVLVSEERLPKVDQRGLGVGLDEEAQQVIDSEMRSLLRVTILSLLVIPLPLAFYATYRVLTVTETMAQLPRIRRKLNLYTIINAMVSCGLIIFYYMLR